MASRKSLKPSSEDRDQLLRLLKSLQDSGQLTGLLNELQSQASTSGATTSGAMHDGSKRRLDDSWQEVSSVESDGVDSQDGVPPHAKKDDEPKFPPAIESVEHWGKTLLTTPRFQKLHLSYAQIVAKAKEDWANGGSEKRDYLKWVFDNPNSNSAKINDFSRYLRFIKWGGSSKPEVYFPGSVEARRFA